MIELKEKIKEYFKNKQNISAVYLFGSAAKNLLRKNSDIDIAILFDPKTKSKIKRFNIILSIGMDLESILKRTVDVVDITNIPLALQHQILKTGELLLEKCRMDRINFEVGSRREYFDMLPLYNKRDKIILQRFME